MLKHLPFYGSLLGRDLEENLKSTNRHVLVYGAVEAHSYGKHGCIASNGCLAEETGLNERVVSNTLGDLKRAGWVSFEIDNVTYQRGEIIPNLNIETPSRKSTTTPTPRIKDTTPPRTEDTTPPVSKVLHRQHLDNSKVTVKATTSPVVLKATKVKPKGKPKALTVEDPTVNNVIELFKVVDLNYATLYARKTERTAVETLLRLHSPVEIAEVLNKAIIYNKLPFVNSYDKIYKPSDLLRNWQKLHDKEAEIKIKPQMAQKEGMAKANSRGVW